MALSADVFGVLRHSQMHLFHEPSGGQGMPATTSLGLREGGDDNVSTTLPVPRRQVLEVGSTVAVSTSSLAVFEATQGLLKAESELTRTLLCGRGGQEHGDDRDEAARRRATWLAIQPRFRRVRSTTRPVRPTRSMTRGTRGTGSPAGDAL